MTGSNKIIGYFSHSRGAVLCDGDACVIAGSRKLMLGYMQEMAPFVPGVDVIKKTKFIEIINGLEHGAAYALDEFSYRIFFPLAKKYGMNDLPLPNKFFSQFTNASMHFIRINIGRN